MPVKHAIWKVESPPRRLSEVSLETEQVLEDMIVSDPRILSEEWMLIGRQEETGHGGRIDLLGIAPDGTLVLIELKRSRTPREVVAQALDYAGWIEGLSAERIAEIFSRFSKGKSLRTELNKRFGEEIDDDSLNQNHQIVIVASSLDDSTERIVRYLNDREIPINVLFFQVFTHGTEQLLSRAWLIDPTETQLHAASGSRVANEPWNGEFYVSFGHGRSRNWEEARRFDFISAGGGSWYSKTLKLLNSGDRIWVNIPRKGYVGVGKVRGPCSRANEFTLTVDGKELPALSVLKDGDYHRIESADPDQAEYFVPVSWIETVPLADAYSESGLFGNQNSVCKPTAPKWRHTIERLKELFPKWSDNLPKNTNETEDTDEAEAPPRVVDKLEQNVAAVHEKLASDLRAKDPKAQEMFRFLGKDINIARKIQGLPPIREDGTFDDI
jgi:hypothetical protein